MYTPNLADHIYWKASYFKLTMYKQNTTKYPLILFCISLYDISNKYMRVQTLIINNLFLFEKSLDRPPIILIFFVGIKISQKTNKRCVDVSRRFRLTSIVPSSNEFIIYIRPPDHRTY